jgi:DASS family divalent anion:Na+ symporter
MPELKSTMRPAELLGWLACLLIPAMVYCFAQVNDLPWAMTNFMVIFIAGILMWVFRLVPEYVPAVFIMLAITLLGLVPESVLLSGFASESFFLALSVFGLGAVVVQSRIFYRASLMILLHLPKRVILLQALVFILGIFLTPIMTAQSSRVALMAPFLEDLKISADLKSKESLINSLVCCAFQGAILFSAVFLTGKSSNFVLYGMFSKQMQWQFSWFNWLVAGSFSGLLLGISFFMLLKLQFKTPKTLSVDIQNIRHELHKLGRLTIEEWASLIAVIFLIVGLSTASIHHISAAWLCFSIFFVLILFGVLGKKEFKQGINWPFLFYLGAIIGIMRCVQEIGGDVLLVQHLSWLEDIADNNVTSFVIVVYFLGWIGSFILGTAAAPALLFTILLPMAENAAINPWLIAFVLLMSTEAWIFPYQSSYYLCYEELMNHSGYSDLRPTLKMNFYFCFIRFMVIMFSLPFWRMMEIL